MILDIWDAIGAAGFVLLFIGLGSFLGWAVTCCVFGAVFVGAYVAREIRLAAKG